MLGPEMLKEGYWLTNVNTSGSGDIEVGGANFEFLEAELPPPYPGSRLKVILGT
jgi:hypothetical protein